MVRETAFDDVFDSQSTFRALLEALSRPGTLCQVPERGYQGAPTGFCLPSLSVLKTLCDHRVSFSLGSAARQPEWIRYLEVNLATPFKSAENADYVLFDGSRLDADFSRLNPGSPEFPESSATAVLCVGRLAEGAEADPGTDDLCSFVLSGPGVKDHAFLTVAGFDPRYADERGRVNRFPPTGIDLFLVDPTGRVAGIPRTSTMEAR